MSPAEFWNMSPYLFGLKVDGYFQQQNRAGHYFRESYALLYNINRGEKNPAISGKDVLRLPGEKKKREYRPKMTVWTPEEIARVTKLMNPTPPAEQTADQDSSAETTQTNVN